MNDEKNDFFWLMQGDCLERMKEIEAGSVDLILTDPPYGTTACSWDTIIPLDEMWRNIHFVSKIEGTEAIFGQEPFSSFLRVSNVEEFKYDWYWRKSRPSGFVNAKLKPLKDIEVISIFSRGTTANGSQRNMKYFPQGIQKIEKEWSRPKNYVSDNKTNPARQNNLTKRILENTNYPRQVLDFSNPNKGLEHPTQKPVALMEYLIKTYTNPGETVLDFTMGSGTTGVAAMNLGRKFIGIEKDEKYFQIAARRIQEASLNPIL